MTKSTRTAFILPAVLLPAAMTVAMSGCSKDCPTVATPGVEVRLIDTEGNFVEVDLASVQATVDGADTYVEAECGGELCSLFFVGVEPGKYVVKANYCDVNVEDTVEVPLDKAGCGPITQHLTLTFGLSECPDES